MSWRMWKVCRWVDGSQFFEQDSHAHPWRKVTLEEADADRVPEPNVRAVVSLRQIMHVTVL